MYILWVVDGWLVTIKISKRNEAQIPPNWWPGIYPARAAISPFVRLGDIRTLFLARPA